MQTIISAVMKVRNGIRLQTVVLEVVCQIAMLLAEVPTNMSVLIVTALRTEEYVNLEEHVVLPYQLMEQVV